MRTVAALLAVMTLLGAPADAQTPAPLAIAAFDFRDTSGEPRDQTAEHAARVKLFDAALREKLTGQSPVRIVPLTCREEPCSARNAGVETLIAQAQGAQARYLLIGEFHKISTLIGTVKLAMYDLGAHKVACDRSFSYRGDNDEAFAHAARFAARDIAQNCLPQN
jgi:hypothetical protein